MILSSGEGVAALDFQSLNISAVSTYSSSPLKRHSHSSSQIFKVFLTPIPLKDASTLLRIILFSVRSTKEEEKRHRHRATTKANEAASGSWRPKPSKASQLRVAIPKDKGI